MKGKLNYVLINQGKLSGLLRRQGIEVEIPLSQSQNAKKIT